MGASELSVILFELEKALTQNPDGAIVEFGCYSGTTSLFIARMLNQKRAPGVFHVYDSFEGLPEKTALDNSPLGIQFKKGELSVSKKTFIQNFKAANLRLPIIHKGWFGEIDEATVPDRISFAFLDGDYYESVMTPLALIQDKLLPSAVIIVDDYGNEALPGARRAVDEWQNAHPGRMRVEASLAILG